MTLLLALLMLAFPQHSFREGFALPDNTPETLMAQGTTPSFAPGSTQTQKMTRSTREIVAIIHGVFDPVGRGDQAVRIAMCESSLNPRAAVIDRDGTVAEGLFQIHPAYWSRFFHGGDPFDPRVNATAAFQIMQAHGWNLAGLWACQ